MESKYYTPDLSEFYVGFEFEMFSGNKWFNIKRTNHFDNFENKLKAEEIRVKYLNEDDLKNFGLTKEEYNLKDYPFLGYYHVDLKIKEYNLYKFTTKYTYLQFWYSPNIKNDYCNLIITCFNDKDNLNCHFKGYIKNKSELQKLLKQLGINE